MSVTFSPRIEVVEEQWTLTCCHDHLLGLIESFEAFIEISSEEMFCEECGFVQQVFCENMMDTVLRENFGQRKALLLLERLGINSPYGEMQAVDFLFRVQNMNVADAGIDSITVGDETVYGIHYRFFEEARGRLLAVAETAMSEDVPVCWG